MTLKKLLIPGIALAALFMAGCTINVNTPDVPVVTGNNNTRVNTGSDDFTSTGLKLRGDGTVDDNDRNRGGDDDRNDDNGGDRSGGDDRDGDDNSGRGS